MEHEENHGEDDILHEDEVGQEIEQDGDAAMDSDDGDQEMQEQDEIQLQNDSAAHMDAHTDSIFCIAQHPVERNIVATGGGDEVAYVFDAAKTPTQQSSDGGRAGIAPRFKVEGHTDSINAITFSLPDGAYLVSAGLDGQMRVYHDDKGDQKQYRLIGKAQEVEEINWLSACPHPEYPNTVAFGASDGSVWVYTLSATDSTSPLTITQTFYVHTAPCTAGTWTPDGKLLCTVSEDGSFYVWDVFGDAASAGVASGTGQQAVVSLDANDERFRVDGGLVSVAVAPNGAFAAVGGMDGGVRVVGLPRLGAGNDATASVKGGAGSKAKAGGARQAHGPKATEASAGQAGVIIASLNAQSESVESITFAAPPLTLMAMGSVDGSILMVDTGKNFAIRRHVKGAHEDEAVIKVEFARGAGPNAPENWILTSCGNNGVLRREDVRTGESREWRGHRGGGEGGGVLGFVQQQQSGQPPRVITAGDDHVALVFDVAA